MPKNNIIICGSCGKTYNNSNIDIIHVYIAAFVCKSQYCKKRYIIHSNVCSMIDKYGDNISSLYRMIIELSYYPMLYNNIVNNYYNNFNVIFKQYLIYMNKEVNYNYVNKLLGILYTNQFESTYPILTELLIVLYLDILYH